MRLGAWWWHTFTVETIHQVIYDYKVMCCVWLGILIYTYDCYTNGNVSYKESKYVPAPKHHGTKGYWIFGSKNSGIRLFSSRGKWVVIFMHPLLSWLTGPGTHWIKVWVGSEVVIGNQRQCRWSYVFHLWIKDEIELCVEDIISLNSLF